MQPIIKWTGGKRKEIKYFQNYFPHFVNNKSSDWCYVEPFIGGGATFFHLQNNKNIINDYDFQLCNFYNCIKNNNILLHKIIVDIIDSNTSLENVYYEQRNLDKNYDFLLQDCYKLAARFFIVNQLAFSGMRRFNSSGHFNVPFGHYKNLNCQKLLNIDYVSLFKNTIVLNCDFEIVMMENDHKNTFVFLDPPYTRVFKEYSYDNNFSEQDHIRLSNVIKNTKNSSIMLVIDSSELTNSLYSDMIVGEYSTKYSVNIKNRFNTDTKHLIITNYK